MSKPTTTLRQMAPQGHENDEQLYRCVDKLADAWLVTRALNAVKDSKFSIELGRSQHKELREAIAEVVERASSNGRIVEVLRKREADRMAPRKKVEAS